MRSVPRLIAGSAFGTALLAHAAFAPSQASEPTFDFAIAAQPLSSALIRYGDVTGKEALYEGGLIDERMSGGFEGRATPIAALKQLLVGTGLVARFVAEGTFVLDRAPEGRSPSSQADRRYHAIVRQDVVDTLCRLPGARQGQYRLVAVLWIAADGAVQDVLRVGNTGSAEADQAIDRSLRALRLREPPPAGFVQPVRLLFTPQSSDLRPDCAASETRRAQGGLP
jgi:hypothetical protein